MPVTGNHGHDSRLAHRRHDPFQVAVVPVLARVQDPERRGADQVSVGAGAGEHPRIPLGDAAHQRREPHHLHIGDGRVGSGRLRARNHAGSSCRAKKERSKTWGSA